MQTSLNNNSCPMCLLDSLPASRSALNGGVVICENKDCQAVIDRWDDGAIISRGKEVTMEDIIKRRKRKPKDPREFQGV